MVCLRDVSNSFSDVREVLTQSRSYSGVEEAESTSRFAQEVTLASEVRPDTPVSEDEDEYDPEYNPLFPMDLDVEQEVHPEPEEEPPVEYDEEGRLTARSKGKGRAE